MTHLLNVGQQRADAHFAQLFGQLPINDLVTRGDHDQLQPRINGLQKRAHPIARQAVERHLAPLVEALVPPGVALALDRLLDGHDGRAVARHGVAGLLVVQRRQQCVAQRRRRDGRGVQLDADGLDARRRVATGRAAGEQHEAGGGTQETVHERLPRQKMKDNV